MSDANDPTHDPLNLRMNWQQDFITKNILVLGYNAWLGYLKGERGAVICSTNRPRLGMVGEGFQTHFVPQSRLAGFLNAWLGATDRAMLHPSFVNAHVLEIVETYNPITELVFLLESFNQVTFFYLRNLPICPPKCYEEICNNWEEFQPGVEDFLN
ncbi:hypothetical protein NEA10_17770 [Phormidium yuhuli AB48]|uniref:Uncharacterized protein n=1 Tax=Phormidium yuhuli AB48 TaxID=2940671 RepID=A0ABY5AP10_9CYAN|nr:hypothetical protein [Phormidium yuhuli]USR90653.1 hypothetical protein NEA10_17770 [Phormidium yuhuli AB48]